MFSSRIRLAALALALLLLGSLRARAGGGPTGVIVIYDSADQRSITIAQRYQTVRGIPERNMVPYAFPSGFSRTTAWDFIDSVRATLSARGLSGQVQAIALAGIFPLDGGQGIPSGAISTEALLFYSPNFSHASAPVTQNYYSSAFNVAQSAFAGPAPLGTTSLAGRSFAGQSYWPVSSIGHCGKSGNSPREILGFIERAPLSDGSKPQGTVYWPLNSDVRSTTRESEIGAVGPVWSARGIRSVVYGSSTTGLGWVSNRPDIVGGMVGTATITTVNANNHYLPGAWVDHLTSYGAVFDSFSPGQTTCSAWLRGGADGSAGTMTEPYAYASKFPHAHIYTHFRAGASLAEAAWLSLQWMAEGMVFGDPLLQPWADFPQVAIGTPAEGSSLSGTVTLNVTATATGGKALEPLLDLFVDGRRIAIGDLSETVSATRNAAGFALNTTTLPDGWHELRVAAYNADPVRTQGEAKRAVLVNNLGQSVALSGPASIDPGGSGTFTLTPAGFTDLAGLTLQANGRVLATLPLTGGSVAIAGTQAPLDGPWTLSAVAKRSGGQEIRSAPLNVPSVWPALAAAPAPSLGTAMSDVRYFDDTTVAGFSWDTTAPTLTTPFAADGTNGINLTATYAAPTLSTNVPGVSIADVTKKPGFELTTWFFAPSDDWYEAATEYVGSSGSGHETALDGLVLPEHNSVFGPAHLSPGWHRLRVRTKITSTAFTQMRLWSRGGTLQDFAVLNRAIAASAGTGAAADAPVLSGISAAADPLTASSTTLTANATAGAGSTDDPANFIYNWVLLAGPVPTRYESATATFTPNGTNAARSTVVKFTRPGTYTVGVQVAGSAGAAMATRTLTAGRTNTKLLLDHGGQATVLQGDTLPLYACTVDQFNFRLAVTPTNPALPTVQWTTNDPNGTFIGTSADGETTGFRSLSSSGSYTVTATGVNGRGSSASFTVALAANTAPTVSGARLFTITQSGAGKPVSFAASMYDADSSPRYTQYAWTVTAAPAGQTLPLSSTTLSAVSGTPTGAGSYTVHLDAGDQTGLTLSDTQTFTWDTAGAAVGPLTVSGPGNVSVKTGDAVSLYATVTGLAPTLQWQTSLDSGATWQNLAGQTAASLSYGPVTSADSGRRFRMAASNSLGTVYGSAGTLTLQSTPGGIIGFSVNSGGSVTSTPTLSVNENDGSASVVVHRLGGSQGAVSVTASLTSSSAVLGSDFRGFDGASATTTTLSWTDGDASDKVLSVPLIDDTIAEPAKVFYVQLSGVAGGAVLSSRTLTLVTIVDDDGPGTAYFVTPTLTVSENAGAAVLTVGRKFPYQGPLSVQYATRALSTDTAAGGDDYIVTAGTLAWTDGDSTPRQITVPILRDGLVEGDEVFTVGLSAADSTLISSPAIASVTIQDPPFQKWQARQFPGVLPVLPAFSGNPAAIRALGPLFHFRFAETSGTTLTGTDGTGAAVATGTLMGTAYTLGQPGPRPALWPGMESTNTSFTDSGSNAGGTPLAWQAGSSVNCGTAAGFGAKLGGGGTLSLWLKTSDTAHAMALVGGAQTGTNTKFLLSVNNEWNTTNLAPHTVKLLIRGQGSPTAEYSVNLQNLPTGSLCDGQWHHLAVTWPKWTDTSNVDYARFFFDGAEANALLVRGTETLTSTATFADFTDAGLRFGYTGVSAGPNLMFAGSLDEIAFFPRVLTPAEVANLAAAAPGAALPADTAAGASPNGDGLTNLFEYYLGGTPAPVLRPVPSTVRDGGLDYLALTYQQNSAATDAAGAVEVSDDLLNWKAGAGFTTVVSNTAAGGARVVTVRDNVPITQSAHRFIRLKVTLP